MAGEAWVRLELRQIHTEMGATVRAIHQLALGLIAAPIVGCFGSIAALTTLV